MAQRCKNLVLDSGPLLSLSPLRDLAENYHTVPQVLDELKDKRAREHFEQLGLSIGVRINIRNPDPASIAQVIQFAKKTGDYAVLSHPDICVLALTHTLQLEENALLEDQKQNVKHDDQVRRSLTQLNDTGNSPQSTPETVPTDDAQDTPTDLHTGSELINLPQSSLLLPQSTEREHVYDLSRAAKNISLNSRPPDVEPQSLGYGRDSPVTTAPEAPSYDDPSADEDDGLGEWITPDNVALHKSRALELLPSSGGYSKTRRRAVDEQRVLVGCMTADFAMQNVLLQMGLTLVGTEGKRIQKVKTWVLRCHACFKICKDSSKQFCPSCGNPTLMRASVTLSSPDTMDAPAIDLHLKKNFQYKLRGTKYPIPAPRPGSAKTGPGEGLVLREDQLEYMRAKKRMDGKRERAEKRMVKGLVDKGSDIGAALGGWSDPDWIPGILGGSTRGKSGAKDEMPRFGYGKKNPNKRRKH